MFRSENSNVAKHLTDLTELDMEMAFEEDCLGLVIVLEALTLFNFDGPRTRPAKEPEFLRIIYQIDELKVPETGKVP